jgi:hypothetical protein
MLFFLGGPILSHWVRRRKYKLGQTLSHASLKMQPHTPVALGFTTGLEVLCAAAQHMGSRARRRLPQRWQPTKRH